MNGFWSGALAALVLSVLGAVSLNILSTFIQTKDSTLVALGGIAGLYLLYLVRQSHVKAGRIIASTLWLLISGAWYLTDPTVTAWIIGQTTMIWVIRCVFHHDSLISAGLDALLNGIALAASIATAWHSRSVALSLWVFFLIQATYVWLPRLHQTPGARQSKPQNPFDQARHSALAALQQLANHHKF